MDKEVINTIFEGIISIVVVSGAGYMVSTRAENTAIVAIASGAAMAVITFWFGQRGAAKATDGTLSALGSISTEVSRSRQEAAQTAQDTVVRTLRAAQPNPPAVVVTTAEEAKRVEGDRDAFRQQPSA